MIRVFLGSKPQIFRIYLDHWKELIRVAQNRKLAWTSSDDSDSCEQLLVLIDAKTEDWLTWNVTWVSSTFGRTLIAYENRVTQRPGLARTSWDIRFVEESSILHSLLAPVVYLKTLPARMNVGMLAHIRVTEIPSNGIFMSKPVPFKVVVDRVDCREHGWHHHFAWIWKFVAGRGVLSYSVGSTSYTSAWVGCNNFAL